MSLDGFVAGPNDDVSHVFAWMSMGDTDYTMTSGDVEIPLKVSEQSVEQFEDAMRGTGALVAGRHLFDITGGWGGRHPLGVPIIVVTHNVPAEWNKPGSSVTFVTDGVASAIAKAKEIAGDRSVAVASPTIVQQCLQLGLLDEIHIDLVPVLLGSGVRLFDQLGISPVELTPTKIATAPGVIHMDFRVIR